MSRILFEFFDGEQTLVVVGIPSAEAFGTPEIDAGDELLVSGIPSAEAFGTPTVTSAPIVQPSIGGYSNWNGGWTSRRRIFREEKRDENPWAGSPPVQFSEHDRDRDSKDEARRALRKVAAWMHPDAVARMHPEGRAQIEAHFRDITELYEALNRREESTRNRKLVTTSTAEDPAWEAFLRSIKPKAGSIVLAGDLADDSPKTIREGRLVGRNRLRRGRLNGQEDAALAVRYPGSRTLWVLIAAVVFFSFYAGWSLSRKPKSKSKKARRKVTSSEPHALV